MPRTCQSIPCEPSTLGSANWVTMGDPYPGLLNPAYHCHCRPICFQDKEVEILNFVKQIIPPKELVSNKGLARPPPEHRCTSPPPTKKGLNSSQPTSPRTFKNTGCTSWINLCAYPTYACQPGIRTQPNATFPIFPPPPLRGPAAAPRPTLAPNAAPRTVRGSRAVLPETEPGVQ